MTRAELVGLAALIVAAFLVDLLIDDHTTFSPRLPANVLESVSPSETLLSEDLAEWDADGSGRLTSAVEDGEQVWSAIGTGRVTWPGSIANLDLDVGFRFPRWAGRRRRHRADPRLGCTRRSRGHA